MKSKLLEINPPHFDVITDIKYATPDNFTGKPVYKKPGVYLHEEAATKLAEAIKLAKSIGLKIKIFDAFRPLEAQQALWNHTPDPNFISPPDTGACPHCRGVAVDLTLLDKNENELDMGTAFDEFTSLSFHGNTQITSTARKNRLILLGIMTSAGWDFYRNEWWHYQLFNCHNYPSISDKEAGTRMMV